MTKEELETFEREYFSQKSPTMKHLRYGQAICYTFDLPKALEDALFYSENVGECQKLIWGHVSTIE